MAAPFKGERVKRWLALFKGGRVKGCKGEKVKKWLRQPTCQLVPLLTGQLVLSSTPILVNSLTYYLIISSPRQLGNLSTGHLVITCHYVLETVCNARIYVCEQYLEVVIFNEKEVCFFSC